MDDRSFDALAKELGAGSSRRAVLGKAARGGLGALLAALGLGAAAEEAAAGRCGRRCRRKATPRARRRCYRRCGKQPSTGGTFQIGQTCATNDQCASGNCVQVAVGVRQCRACPEDRRCAGGCCGIGLVCVPALGLCV